MYHHLASLEAARKEWDSRTILHNYLQSLRKKHQPSRKIDEPENIHDTYSLFQRFFLHPGPSSAKHQDQDTPCQLHRWERDFRLVSLSLRHHVALEWAAPNGWAPPCRMEGSNMGQQSKNPTFLDAHFKWKLNFPMGSLYLVLVTYVNSWNEQPTLIMRKAASTDPLTDQLTS